MSVSVKVGPKFQVVIPQKIRRKVPLHPQKKVLVEEINGVIFIFPRPSSFAEFMAGLGKDVWKGIDPKAHVKREREGWK
ncbi:MAG: AbrB/MazE/SpoVT family DNA-binding domain-containing protein [Syntrophaceae bacterium]|jgi:AbrB family looped-hinge helix DNA binding protein|nr:AbrB/MazE/SpoVT family DNA-binding domain-containing protein [Syntrophaceae bacterium]